MRQASQRQVSDFAPDVEIDHLTAGRGLIAAVSGSGRTQHIGVILTEEEIVQNGVQLGYARCPLAGGGNGFTHLVVVDVALEYRLGLGVIAQLPQFGNILERGDEAFARRGVVHRRHPRTLARFIHHRNDALQTQIRRL